MNDVQDKMTDARNDATEHGFYEPNSEMNVKGHPIPGLGEQVYYVPARKVKWPVILFVLTCLSTFWVGVTDWLPVQSLIVAAENGNLLNVRQAMLAHWPQGLLYMGAVLLILLLHELGHFITTILYRIPASMPIFLPFPLNPIGTLGAVIAMHGNLADRKQIFDIGIAGPIAGLVAAIPLTFIGISQLDLSIQPHGGLGFRLPLLMQWIATSMAVEGYNPGQPIRINQLNPIFTAAWVGLLITGLNMMPVGQLDGGHITYTLFGDSAHWIAQGVIVFAIAFMVYHQNFMLVVMVLLLLVIGTNHPPTRDDKVPLGTLRWVLGVGSLAIPILCFPPLIFQIVY